jgi:hypothetical protein
MLDGFFRLAQLDGRRYVAHVSATYVATRQRNLKLIDSLQRQMKGLINKEKRSLTLISWCKMKKNTKGVAVRRSKCSSSNASSKSITKKFMLSAVQVIAEQIVQLKKRNGGKLPYGEFSKLWNAGKATYPNMSRKTINNYVKK